MGFFWITVNDVSFGFGVIILLWLFAVIGIYIYLASIETKIPDEQVPKLLLSRDCERSFQFIPKEKLLLSTGVGWRVLEKSSLGCSGDDDGWNFFWTTVEMEYFDIDIADDIVNIFSSLSESYVSSPRSELWPVMFYFIFWKSKRF